MGFEHTSVLPQEVHAFQDLKPGDVCVDCTLGGAGHALSTLRSILPDGRLIGIDQDMDAIGHAQTVLHPYKDNVTLVHSNFSRLPEILRQEGIRGADSILLDLGFSLNQIKHAKRGFSFNQDEPLDMRMDTRNELTAREIVNSYTEKELADLFFRFGEERLSRRIARAIVGRRTERHFSTSKDLAGVIVDAVPKKQAAQQKIHPATRVFQALRIAVNRELERLQVFMDGVPDLLNKGGRLCVISFHSLEDRIVKQAIRKFEAGCTCPKELPQCICNVTPKLKSVVRKPITATREEITANPMARSAKLRVALRV